MLRGSSVDNKLVLQFLPHMTKDISNEGRKITPDPLPQETEDFYGFTMNRLLDSVPE
jgi:hypothetical protein